MERETGYAAERELAAGFGAGLCQTTQPATQARQHGG
jgi:hypothetical protein